VVVKTVVTVNLVIENFPLDTPITKWARAVLWSVALFSNPSHAYLPCLSSGFRPSFQLFNTLFSGTILGTSTRQLFRIIVIRSYNYSIAKILLFTPEPFLFWAVI
jgi:hypothetical protein